VSTLSRLGKDELLASIREIAPIIQEEAVAGAHRGALTERAQEALIGSGLIGTAAPAELGGSGLPGADWLEVLEEMNRVDGHAGWVLMALSSHAGLFGAALYDDGVEEIFANGIPRIAGMPAPRGRAVRTEGGYLFTGKHQFASGAALATHFVAGGIVHGDDGKPLMADNGVPEMVMVVIPRDEVHEQGNWDVNGMEATSSIDYEIGPELFVPERRTLPLNPWRQDFPRGVTYWKIGVDALGPAGHTPCCLGMAQRALQEVATIAPTRMRRDMEFPTLADQPTFQHDLVQLHGQLTAARVAFHDVMAKADAEVTQTGGPASPLMTHRIKQLVRNAHDVAVKCGDFAYQHAGSTGFRNGHVVSRLLRDLHTINTHVVVDPQLLNAAAPAVIADLQEGLAA